MASPLVEQFRKGGVSRDVRLTAAAGSLPLNPMDQVELLYLLTRDRDDEVRTKAEANLLEIKQEGLQSVLKDTAANPKVLEFFGTRLSAPDLLEMILRNSGTEDQTIRAMVPRLSADLLEIVVINQTRSLRHVPLLEALEASENLTQDQRRRLTELRHDFKIGVTETPAEAPPPAEPEALMDLETGPPEEEAPPPKTIEDAISPVWRWRSQRGRTPVPSHGVSAPGANDGGRENDGGPQRGSRGQGDVAPRPKPRRLLCRAQQSTAHRIRSRGLRGNEKCVF